MLRREEHPDGIVELAMDRPPANALDLELVEALRGGLAEAVAAGAEGIVLSGRPGMFSAGLDVPHLLGLERPGIEALWGAYLSLLREIAECAVPVSAAITGHSPAGGAVNALFCDERVMAEGEYRIGLNEVSVGIALPREIFGPLVRLVGERQAERLGVGGLMIPAAEALRLGLVDELVPLERVTERAVERLRALLALPRGPMLATRAMFRSELAAGLDSARVVQLLVEQWFSDTTQTALRRLVDRLRRPGKES
ncbi:MAG: enoyl-CoA hydratase/isomerase family protein [Thermoanaerobaculia bacterium]